MSQGPFIFIECIAVDITVLLAIFREGAGRVFFKLADVSQQAYFSLDV
jgi:hypothetical protein